MRVHESQYKYEKLILPIINDNPALKTDPNIINWIELFIVLCKTNSR